MAETELQTVRGDIDTIINTSEYASTVTLIKVSKTIDDSGNLSSITNESTSITVLIQPTGAKNLEIDEYGEPIIGNKKVFFKHQYTNSQDEIIFPEIDDKITDVSGYQWRIKELNPWVVGNGIAYYDGSIIRDDLN